MRLLSAYFFSSSKMRHFSYLRNYTPTERKNSLHFLSYINYMVYICNNIKRLINALNNINHLTQLI